MTVRHLIRLDYVGYGRISARAVGSQESRRAGGVFEPPTGVSFLLMVRKEATLESESQRAVYARATKISRLKGRGRASGDCCQGLV